VTDTAEVELEKCTSGSPWLAVSLHAANQELRETIIPSAKVGQCRLNLSNPS